MFSGYTYSKDTQGQDVPLAFIVEAIRTGRNGLDEKTVKCQRLAQGDQKVYRAFKEMNLPAFTPSGTFAKGKRNGKGLVTHSGYVIIDIDHLGGTLPDMILSLRDHPNVKLLFVSPSGDGLKALCPVDPLPTNIDEHKAAWKACVNNFAEITEEHEAEIDTNGKDLPRLCFLAHDPQVILRDATEPIPWEMPKVEPAKQKPNYTGKIDLTPLNFIPCDADIGDVKAYDVWLHIGMALKEIGAKVEDWDKWSQGTEIPGYYQAGECQKKWDSFKREDGDKVGWTRIIEYAKAGGYEPEKKTKRRENPIPGMKDASEYFIHDDFNVLAMSDFIQTKFTVWAQDSGIYIYDEKTGCYKPGEIEINATVRDELCELRKASYCTEVLKDLADTCRRNVPDNSHLIGFRNGVLTLHFDTGEGEFHPHSPDNYLMSVFPINYEPNPEKTESAEDFNEWLLDVLNDDAELHRLIFQIIGSIFHKRSVDMQRGVLLVGEGGTGKSMLLSQIERMVGRENICARAWGDYGFNDFAFGDLYDKSLALDSDIDVSRPLSGSIKPAMTGNIVTCNKKYQQPFDFNPHATWIGSINKFPRTKDKTWGFFRRWIAIPFDKSFKTDSSFEAEKRKLWSDPKTMTFILAAAIQQYMAAYMQGSFMIPEAAATLSREMYQSANSVISWLDEETTPDAEACISRNEAYQSYAMFCQEKGYNTDSNKEFYNTLRTQGYNPDRQSRVNGEKTRVVQGLRLDGSDFSL